MSARKVDVVVVGAGAMGSSTAWWLARRGIDVALLEQFEPGHTRGSSHGGTRIFRFAYYDPMYVRMAQDALPLWRELEDDAGEPLLDTTGAIDHGNSASIEAVAGAMSACGAPFERLGTTEGSERWPAMRRNRALSPGWWTVPGGRHGCRAAASSGGARGRRAVRGQGGVASSR